MIPIPQTQFGTDWKDPETVGNCHIACVASILELSLSQIPHFLAVGGEENWWKEQEAWLAKRGLGYIELQLPNTAIPVHPDAFCIVVGESPRTGKLHSCVYKNGEIIHDPHPDNTGLITQDVLGLFYSLDPCDTSDYKSS